MDNYDRGREKYLAYIQKSKELKAKTSYTKKIVVAGLFIEEYIYENEIIHGRKRKIRKNKSQAKTEQTEMRGDALRRTRMNIMRLVNSNSDFMTFLTLTFDENKFENKQDITELEKCNYCFKTFILRLKHQFPDIKYLAVPEFQGDYYFKTGIKKEFGGAVHYHLLLNQKIETERMEEIWRHGFIKINKVKSVNNIGLYVSKYLSKESFNKKYFGKRKFFYSRNLSRPKEYKGQDCEPILANLPELKLVYEKEFENKYRGKVKVNLYKI